MKTFSDYDIYIYIYDNEQACRKYSFFVPERMYLYLYLKLVVCVKKSVCVSSLRGLRF